MQLTSTESCRHQQHDPDMRGQANAQARAYLSTPTRHGNMFMGGDEAGLSSAHAVCIIPTFAGEDVLAVLLKGSSAQ